MKAFCSIWICCLAVFAACCQSSVKGGMANIVPNAGFEQYGATPIGWFYKGRHFTNVVKYWSSATAASPDVFGPKVRVPTQWAEKGFGKQKARGGASMVGITLYGCEKGKPHCREYIQIQLSEPLVIEQNYYAEFWVSHLPRSLQINNIGIHFSEKVIAFKTDDMLSFDPQLRAFDIVDASNDKWVKISGSFKAETEANYLIIGNFFPDSLTEVRVACEDHFNYAYYYVDDVLVYKEEPVLPVPLKKNDLTRIKIEKGKLIRLKNIFFETDKAELLPRSYIELNKLLKLMQENPSMIIQINGHTDIRGGDHYNMGLSLRRAKAVADFLNAGGVKQSRTRFKGFGSELPIASNGTEEGRQLNRRVEFLIIRK